MIGYKLPALCRPHFPAFFFEPKKTNRVFYFEKEFQVKLKYLCFSPEEAHYIPESSTSEYSTLILECAQHKQERLVQPLLARMPPAQRDRFVASVDSSIKLFWSVTEKKNTTKNKPKQKTKHGKKLTQFSFL